jgi:hypothetical protein
MPNHNKLQLLKQQIIVTFNPNLLNHILKNPQLNKPIFDRLQNNKL